MFLRCKMHFYYINVDSQKVRNQNMIKQFEERNIKYTRIDAIKPEKEQPSKVDYERCCTRSHIKAIETFLKNEDGNHCVICEDDLSFEFECFWTKPLEEIVKDAPNNWGIIQIAYILQTNLQTSGHRIKAGSQVTNSRLPTTKDCRCRQLLLDLLEA